MNLASRLEYFAALQPNKSAFIYMDDRQRWHTITYRQMADATRRLTFGLQACGARAGLRAALMTPTSADFFPLAFALLQLGVVPIVIDPAIGLKKLGECLNEASPDMFIGNTLTHLLRKLLGWGKASVKINTSIPQLLRNTQHAAPITDDQSPASDAAIIYTSGSTGTPKGALYNQANLAAQLELLAETFHIAADEIDLPAFPLYALIDVLLGVTSVIPDMRFPAPKNINPQKIVNAINQFNVTNMFASPIVLDKLAQYGIPRGIKLPSLKRVITAGAPAPLHLQRRFRNLLADETDLFGIYGATEALPIALVESRELFTDAQSKTAQGTGVCLGKPVNGIAVQVIEITEAEIEQFTAAIRQPVNVMGEITVKGKSVTAAYIGRAEVNRLAKIKDGADVIHRMGDVGYFDEQGRLWYCGRKAQRVVTQTGVLFTEQIEGIFNAHPLVYRTALVGVKQPAGNFQEPVLWVELEKGARADQENIKRELMELAKEHPQAARIKKFLFSKQFPTDVRHNSKIIREKLAGLVK